jgi:hypothetical protein
MGKKAVPYKEHQQGIAKTSNGKKKDEQSEAGAQFAEHC